MLTNTPSPESIPPQGFTFEDCRWLSKNGIDYRLQELVDQLRNQRS